MVYSIRAPEGLPEGGRSGHNASKAAYDMLVRPIVRHRERVRAAIRTFIAERCVGETVEFRTPVLVAIGYRI